MKKATALLALVIVFGCMSVIPHDEDAAAKKALEFANTAFILHDDAASYRLLSEETRRAMTPERYAEMMKQMHPAGFPTTVTANQFEPIPGQPAMSIILLGQNDKEQFHYRLVMIGTTDQGYVVGGVFRANGPYPGNPALHGAKLLQPLKPGYTVSASALSAATPASGAPTSTR